MKRKAISVAIEVEGEMEYHLPSAPDTTDHLTLCGMDGMDDSLLVEQILIDGASSHPVTCPTCRAIWLHVVGLRITESDFDCRR